MNSGSEHKCTNTTMSKTDSQTNMKLSCPRERERIYLWTNWMWIKENTKYKNGNGKNDKDRRKVNKIAQYSVIWVWSQCDFIWCVRVFTLFFFTAVFFCFINKIKTMFAHEFNIVLLFLLNCFIFLALTLNLFYIL